MENSFCYQCKLQFDTKLLFKHHASLVHGIVFSKKEPIAIKEKAIPARNSSAVEIQRLKINAASDYFKKLCENENSTILTAQKQLQELGVVTKNLSSIDPTTAFENSNQPTKSSCQKKYVNEAEEPIKYESEEKSSNLNNSSRSKYVSKETIELPYEIKDFFQM